MLPLNTQTNSMSMDDTVHIFHLPQHHHHERNEMKNIYIYGEKENPRNSFHVYLMGFIITYYRDGDHHQRPFLINL